MYCNNCGAKLEDGATFCTECGARVEDVATGPLGAERAPGATRPVETAAGRTVVRPAIVPPTPIDPSQDRHPNRPPQEPQNSRARIVVAAGLALALVAGGGAALYLGVIAPQQRAAEEQASQQAAVQAADDAAHSDHTVKIGIKAASWDTDAGASKLPVAVKGEDLDGNSIDTTAYVDSYGDGIVLKQGKYDLSFPASPLGASGQLWSPKSGQATVTLGDKLGDGEAVDVSDTVIANLGEPIDATSVTDDALSQAQSYAEKGGCSSSSAAQQLVQAATNKRNDELRTKRASELTKGSYSSDSSYTCDDFSFTVPAGWGVNWSVRYDYPDDKWHANHPFRRYRVYKGGQAMFSILCDAIDYGGYPKAIKHDTLSNGQTFCLVSAGEKDDDTSWDGCSTVLSSLQLH